MTLNANSYRDILRKKLEESDCGLPQPTVVPAKEATYSGVLDSLREKLFGPDNVQETPTGVDTGVATEDAYQHSSEAPNSAVSSNAVMGPESEEAELTAEDLNDLATDTIAEVLNSVKELRDQVKKENPKKAALVRRIYDHLLKGKEKITAEILKSHEDEKAQTVEKPTVQ
jgi:hypothetical protein